MQYDMDVRMMGYIVKTGADVEAVGRDVVGFRPHQALGLHQLLPVVPVDLQPLPVFSRQAVNEPPLDCIWALLHSALGVRYVHFAPPVKERSLLV